MCNELLGMCCLSPFELSLIPGEPSRVGRWKATARLSSESWFEAMTCTMPVLTSRWPSHERVKMEQREL